MNLETINKLIIISSPSGAGKTTLCKLLIKKMKNINLSISYTSRSKRLNEIEGKDYHFVTKQKFNELKKKIILLKLQKILIIYTVHLLKIFIGLKIKKCIFYLI